MLGASMKILSCYLDNSTIDMPYIVCIVLPSPPHEVFLVLPKSTILQLVKVKKLESIIEFSSKSKNESPNLTLEK